MAVVNPEKTEITAKIVYYGPGLSGKTTCIQHIYRSLPAPNKGKLLSLASDVDRTIFFDFLPLKLENVSGFLLRLQLYTVPGQVRYNATRKAVLQDIDGIVFVADLQKDMRKANEESMKNLFDNLKEHGRTLQDLPHVFQYNKDDLPNHAAFEEIDANINIYKAPTFRSCALTGLGVLDALKGLTKLVVNDIRQRRVIEKHLSKASRDAHAAMRAEPMKGDPTLAVLKGEPAAGSGAPPRHASLGAVTANLPQTAPAGAGSAAPPSTPEQDASQLARRLLHSGIAAPTSRVSSTAPARSPALPASIPPSVDEDAAPPTLRLSREELAEAASDKEIVVFSDRADELTSGIHRRPRIGDSGLFSFGSLAEPAATEAAAGGEVQAIEDAEIDDTLASLPEDESHLLEIPEDPPPSRSVGGSMDDTSRHGALGGRGKARRGPRPSSLAALVEVRAARTCLEEMEARLDGGELEELPRLAREALESLLDDPAIFPESDGMGPAARINVLAVRHRRFLRFRELTSRAALSREEALYCIHFLVDVALSKKEVGQ